MEDDFSVEKPRIARLTGPNYRPWSVQVQRLLLSQSLWDVVRLGIETPETTATEPVVTGQPGPRTTGLLSPTEGRAPASGARTVIKDARASTVIMALCSQNVLQHVLLLDTAKEQWEALKALYSPLGLQQLSAKILAFTSYRPGTSASVTEVATRLSTLQHEIGAIDPAERPSDTLKISILFQAIRALDQRFEPLILQLEITDMATNYDKIVTHLTEFERRMGPKEPVEESVFTVQQRQRRGFNGKCFTCNQRGHKSFECEFKDTAEDPEAASREPNTGPSTGPLATPSGGRGLSPPLAQANTVTEACWRAEIDPESQPSLLWVIDSGCSRHMTFARDAFTEYRLLDEPIQVNIASGAAIQGIATGTVALKVALKGSIRTVSLTDVLHVPELAGSLISVTQLQDRGITICTTRQGECLIELNDTIIGVASRLGKAYALNSSLGGLDSGYLALKTTTSNPESLSNAEPTRVESPDIEGPDTIVADIQARATESPEPGDLNSEDLRPKGSEFSDIDSETPGFEPTIQQSSRVCRPPQRYQAYSATERIKLPKSYAEAMADPLNKASWEQAIREELTKLQALDTWEYAELPPGKMSVGYKWYKARLVIQGFSQVLEDDYLETFSPTIRAESLRTLLALGTAKDLKTRQIDMRDRPNRSLKINQNPYIQEVLQGFRLGDAKSINLPISDHKALIKGKDPEPLVDQSLYQEAIGCLGCFDTFRALNTALLMAYKRCIQGLFSL